MYYDAIEEIENSIPDNTTTNPNDRYNESIYTISSTTDADNFCNKYNHANNYNGLALGQRIKINDGYNTIWLIAGFDCEYNHIASDGTIKDNGYGICLIPENGLLLAAWDETYGNQLYINSTQHTATLPEIATNLRIVLGTHLISRRVLLSSSAQINSNNYVFSNAYTWTSAYCTLMSGCQVTGTTAMYYNKYDDGEANYKLPLFNYIDYRSSLKYWLRGYNLYGSRSVYAYYVGNTGIDYDLVSRNNISTKFITRPMIYIR